VKRYADAHGAEVSVESEVGRGTTVGILLPPA
jgi:signal transduction histidine kinase